MNNEILKTVSDASLQGFAIQRQIIDQGEIIEQEIVQSTDPNFRTIIDRMVEDNNDYRAKQTFFQQYLASNPVPTFTWKYRGNEFVLENVNLAANRVTIDKAVNFIGMTSDQIYPDLPIIREKLFECFNNKNDIEFELNYKTRYAHDYEWIKFNFSYAGPDHVLLFTETFTKRKKAENETIRANEMVAEIDTQFKGLFESAADAMFIADIATGIILKANQAASKLLKMPQDKIKGLHQSDLHPKTDIEYSHQTFSFHNKLADKDIHIEPIEHKVVCHDGTIIDVEILASIVQYNKQQCLLGIFRDVTSRKNVEKEYRLQENLKKQFAIAQESLKFKQNFLANMSHEIRTPLTGVLGMVEILGKTTLDSEQRDYIDTIIQSGENLREIINTVLDFSKIEAGKIELRTHVFSVSAILQNAQNLFNSICRKPITFEYNIDPQIPEFILADELRIKQVVNNLISNAVKFTSKGKVFFSISLETEKSASGDICLKIEVSDTGKGISEQTLKFLFQPFSQIDDNDTREFEGTGLGLSICKELAKLQGGDIGVRSKSEKGSTFWFTFLAREADGELTENIKVKDDSTKTEWKLNILLAEDKPVNQKVVRLMLSSLGHSVTIVSNGKEAVEVFEPGKFDLILMDIQMPVMDGITAVSKIRSQYKSTPPIIGLSANAFEGDREKYMAQGLDEYLTKPLRINDFLSAIDKVL